MRIENTAFNKVLAVTIILVIIYIAYVVQIPAVNTWLRNVFTFSVPPKLQDTGFSVSQVRGNVFADHMNGLTETLVQYRQIYHKDALVLADESRIVIRSGHSAVFIDQLSDCTVTAESDTVVRFFFRHGRARFLVPDPSDRQVIIETEAATLFPSGAVVDLVTDVAGTTTIVTIDGYVTARAKFRQPPTTFVCVPHSGFQFTYHASPQPILPDANVIRALIVFKKSAWDQSPLSAMFTNKLYGQLEEEEKKYSVKAEQLYRKHIKVFDEYLNAEELEMTRDKIPMLEHNLQQLKKEYRNYYAERYSIISSRKKKEATREQIVAREEKHIAELLKNEYITLYGDQQGPAYFKEDYALYHDGIPVKRLLRVLTRIKYYHPSSLAAE